jgi:hypothetical protein
MNRPSLTDSRGKMICAGMICLIILAAQELDFSAVVALIQLISGNGVRFLRRNLDI